VRYVLEGSVRKAAGRVRITAQLIDATNGAHVWAERFEAPLDDIFELQDRVAANVAGTIEPTLRNAEIERAQRKPTESLDAYDLYLRALARGVPHTGATREDNQEARRLLRRAIEIDPQYGAAYGFAGQCYMNQRAMGWLRPDDPALAEGARLARLAAMFGQDDPATLASAAMGISRIEGDHVSATALIDRALKINPNSANAWRVSGAIRNSLGEPDTAIEHLERAGRLSPLDRQEWFRCLLVAQAHFYAERYAEALAWANKALHDVPRYVPVLNVKAAACGLLGRIDEARACVAQLLALNPTMTCAGMRPYYRAFIQPACLERHVDGLRKAGLPE
jgi:tetratricopeptide (TPR) repeat protein